MKQNSPRGRVMTAALLAATLWTLTMPIHANAANGAAEELYYSANALYNRKLYELAVEEYKSFLEKHATHAKVNNARMGLGLSHYALGNYKAAKPLLANDGVDVLNAKRVGASEHCARIVRVGDAVEHDGELVRPSIDDFP